MTRRAHSLTLAGFLPGTLAALAVGIGLTAGAGPVSAVVYCKTVGIPQGCVVRPVAPVVVAPAPVVVAPRPVVVAPRAVVVAPGTPMNRGGPVNRVGRR
jgi:hypothetical protein